MSPSVRSMGCAYYSQLVYDIIWEPCLGGIKNSKGAEQTVRLHQRSLITAFVIRLLKSILSRLAASKDAELACLNRILSEFSRPNYSIDGMRV